MTLKTTTSPTRPLAYTVIAWLAILVGSWMFLCGLGAAIQSLTTPPVIDLPRDLIRRFPFVNFIFQHYFLIAVAQSIIGISAVIGGIFLFRLRVFARNLVELICWVLMFGIIIFGGQFLIPPLDYLSWGGLFCTVILTVPFILVIFFLRKSGNQIAKNNSSHFS